VPISCERWWPSRSCWAHRPGRLSSVIYFPPPSIPRPRSQILCRKRRPSAPHTSRTRPSACRARDPFPSLSGSWRCFQHSCSLDRFCATGQQPAHQLLTAAVSYDEVVALVWLARCCGLEAQFPLHFTPKRHRPGLRDLTSAPPTQNPEPRGRAAAAPGCSASRARQVDRTPSVASARWRGMSAPRLACQLSRAGDRSPDQGAADRGENAWIAFSIRQRHFVANEPISPPERSGLSAWLPGLGGWPLRPQGWPVQ